MSGESTIDASFTCFYSTATHKREWSLITGMGGLQNGREGGQVKFYPYEKGGAEKVLAMLKGGGGAQQVLGQFLRGSLKF